MNYYEACFFMWFYFATLETLLEMGNWSERKLYTFRLGKARWFCLESDKIQPIFDEIFAHLWRSLD